MMNLESVTNMVVGSLQESSDFEEVTTTEPGVIYLKLDEDGRYSHFEIKIEEF